MNPAIAVAPILAVAVAAVVLKRRKKAAIRKRTARINAFSFPDRLVRKVRDTYPHLTQEQGRLVLRGLREYFHVCNMAGNRMVAMPSQAVDVAWHEFILFTRQYDAFCRSALGRFLHHTPAEAMRSRTLAQDGIKRAWRLCCLREKQDPRAATTLPLLFALDTVLDIPDGFRYSLNCVGSSGGRNDYCASHIGCSSGCGGGCSGDSGSDGSFLDSMFGGDSDGGGDSGCGGGCGGD